jgi:hypothetical protein
MGDAEWTIFALFLIGNRPRGRRRTLDGIFWITRTGARNGMYKRLARDPRLAPGCDGQQGRASGRFECIHVDPNCFQTVQFGTKIGRLAQTPKLLCCAQYHMRSGTPSSFETYSYRNCSQTAFI